MNTSRKSVMLYPDGNRNGKPLLKILHTADVHLGDDLQPDLARQAFVGVVERALAEEPDVVIIAGDLFDSGRAARTYLDFALGELARLPMPVVLLPGNHDPYDEGSAYREIDIADRCPHVHLITDTAGELLHFPDLHLTLWGKPVVEHSPEFQPIGDIPERTGNDWHVVVAHGFHVPDGLESHRSSPILGREIAGSDWDYIALGHVHPFRDVSRGGVIACYSGSPTRFSLEHGGQVAIVEMNPAQGVRVRPVPVDGERDSQGWTGWDRGPI